MKVMLSYVLLSLITVLAYTAPMFETGVGCNSASANHPTESNGSSFSNSFVIGALRDCNNVIAVSVSQNNQQIGNQKMIAGSPYCIADVANGCDFRAIPLNQRKRGDTAIATCADDNSIPCTGNCNIKSGNWQDVNNSNFSQCNIVTTTTTSSTTITFDAGCGLVGLGRIGYPTKAICEANATDCIDACSTSGWEGAGCVSWWCGIPN